MCQRSIFSRSCIRIAEEVQLQAEEEWILEALKKIKQQRNALQIERLHLENMKMQLNNPMRKKDDKTQTSEAETSKDTSYSASRKEPMSAVNMMTLGRRQADELAVMNDDTHCNNEELNLNISNPFGRACWSDEGSTDASDGEDVRIDINMLMNGAERDH